MSNAGSWDGWDEALGHLDPELDSHLYEAAIDRAMTLEIGLAARCHVSLDSVLHATAATLSGTKVSASTTTARLIETIEAAIAATPLRGYGANFAASDALESARHANKRRNRVLHDQWMAVFDDEDGPSIERTSTSVTAGIAPSRETLASISDVSAELTTAYHRILGILLYSKMSSGLREDEIARECKTALSLIRGEFRS